MRGYQRQESPAASEGLDAGNLNRREIEAARIWAAPASDITEEGVRARMEHYKYTEYFEREVLRKRSYLKKAWCIQVLENPIRSEPQEGNRFRFWGRVEELGGRFLRVVTLEDKLTIHNAFPDRGFKE